MFRSNILELCPYASDVFEWLKEQRRFSNIRHPFRKKDFESRILNEICASMGSSIFESSQSPFPATDLLLSDPKHLLSYVESLVRSHYGQSHLEICVRKSWMLKNDNAAFKLKLKELLADFELSTSRYGEPVSILTIQTDG